MRIAQEEIFGPVVSLIEVNSFEEAIEVNNGVKYGLIKFHIFDKMSIKFSMRNAI